MIAWFASYGAPIARIGLEAGPLSQWLYAGMKAAGLPVELLETRHVRDAFKSMPVKTDRKDASGIAQLMRLGWFRPVHRKSLPSQEVRALLSVRKLLQTKRIDVEMSIRGILRGFGLKVGSTTSRTFEPRVQELVAQHERLRLISDALLKARAVLEAEFKSSRTVGAHFGLTQNKYQSGETDITGRISKCGDEEVRTALYEAANVILTRPVKPSLLKDWAMGVARRAGKKKAKIALARKLAVILRRMLVDGTAFDAAKSARPVAA